MSTPRSAADLKKSDVGADGARAYREKHGFDQRLVLIINTVPCFELLCDAVLPHVKLVLVDYTGGTLDLDALDADGDGSVSFKEMNVLGKDADDMKVMGKEMMEAMGTEYTCVGIMDAAGKKGFSTLSGHLVPTEMLGTNPEKAGNFVRLLNFIADHYLRGVPFGQSIADGRFYKHGPLPPNNYAHYFHPPSATMQPKGQIDLLACPGVPMDACARLRPDVAKWSSGTVEAARYFDPEKMAKWKTAVCMAKDKFIFD